MRNEVLLARPANQVLRDAEIKPIPKMLFDTFWHEGETCIAFGDTNVGKSILANQIGDSISKGIPISNFKLEAEKQPVIYLDFEQSDKQYHKRYSQEYQNNYVFDDKFIRCGIDKQATDFEDLPRKILAKAEMLILEHKSKVLIVDNITWLAARTTNATEANMLMRKLSELKNKYDLSILIIAHTPKRNLSKAITQNDLGGSKHIANFADSMFCIGISSFNNHCRYLKQVKSREEKLYEEDNVVVCSIEKPLNFLGFEFIEYATEEEHLVKVKQLDNAELDNNIIQLKTLQPELSLREIAKQLNTNAMRVSRVLERSVV